MYEYIYINFHIIITDTDYSTIIVYYMINGVFFIVCHSNLFLFLVRCLFATEILLKIKPQFESYIFF